MSAPLSGKPAPDGQRISGIFGEVDPKNLAHPTLAFLREWWDRKRGERPMPARADLHPAELKEHLGWIILVDVFPDLSDFRYRLIGSRVSDYFGMNGTGKTIREAFGPISEAAMNATLAIHRKTARDRVPMRSYGGAGWIGRDYQDFDALFLPLSEDGERASMILSCFTFDARKLKPRSPQGEGSRL